MLNGAKERLGKRWLTLDYVASVKQGPVSNWPSWQSVFRIGEAHRQAGEVIGKKAGFPSQKE